ncbi:hypothetical protein IMZ48_44425, partial [Candidatus Bathyarchaeota archaeon]|nr:hypothetical protein [Candidatus Bathyarchaeota archaeon]
KCLVTLFQNTPSFDWTPYADTIVKEVVTPRIEKLPVETAQGVSVILQLLSTWSTMPQESLLLSIDNRILPQLVECLAVEKGKPEVKVHVLGIIRNLVTLAKAPMEESMNNELIKTELLGPVLDRILENIAGLLEATNIPNDLLETCVEAIIELSPIVEDSKSVQGILDLSCRFLSQPARRISPKTKGRVILVVEGFVALQEPMSSPSSSPELLMKIHESLSALFSYFKDRQNRESLCRVYMVLATKDPSLQKSAELCLELNTFLERRIDEPDYDRRLAALNSISRPRDENFTAQQWLPLLHNLVFFIHVEEEYRVLSYNSADAMRQYIDEAAQCTDVEVRALFESQLKSILMPALYSGARDESDAIRREHLRVMGRLVSQMPEWPPVANMSGLLDGTEEETGEPQFFFNILSPALSKQLEALQLLVEANKKQEMGSMNLANFFIPLLEHFILGREEGTDDKGLGAQASLVIGELAASLDWKQYRSILQRYIGYISSKPERQKVLVRLLGQFVDALANARGPDRVGNAVEDGMDLDESLPSTPPRKLERTIPKGEKLTSELVNNYLPPLMKYLNEKDESEVSHRVPVGVIIVKMLKLLPHEDMSMRLAAVLSDVSHILRSKGEESRDMARDTLVKISLNLGPAYFGFILRGLKSALVRGYQLHVLSYTVHSILLSVIPAFGQGTIDYCIPSIVSVIMDDIFGVTGQEKDADDYTTQTKEIRSSKSQDSMELVAKTASVIHLVDLVRPIQAMLLQKVDLKMVRKIDTLLSRIATGLLHNPAAESRDTLVFCYEIVQEVYKSRTAVQQPRLDYKTRRYLVQKAGKKSDRGIASKHTYKLVRFALDILRTVLKRHDGLRNATNITGFIPIIGDAVTDGESELKIAAFRLLNVMV